MQKTALVTGANRGIGLQTAKELAGRDFRVFVGTRDERAGAAAVASVGNNAEVLVVDVADAKSICGRRTDPCRTN